jgi:predicted Fe-Mo cluster-binding NifX family protein
MKIGITAEGPDLEARVGHRFGLSKYLLIVDSETLSMEAVPNEGAVSGEHSGIQMIILAISHQVETLITGYLSPTVEGHLIKNGIKVIHGFKGNASTALEAVRAGQSFHDTFQDDNKGKAVKREFFPTLKRSMKQFAGLLPVMGGVVLLIGLFKTFLTREMISGFFLGRGLPDAFFGTCLGSLLAGNPINSYLIGGELLDRGVTLFGVTAFITAWVSVGLLQLPAEMAALGKLFALARNGLSFLFSIVMSLLTAGLFYLIMG